MLTQKAAENIWHCYREIQVGEELLKTMEEEIARHKTEGRNPAALTVKDSWGRERELQLGIPTGENGHRLLRVAPRIALAIIRAHIAEKRAELVTANEQARIEIETPN